MFALNFWRVRNDRIFNGVDVFMLLKMLFLRSLLFDWLKATVCVLFSVSVVDFVNLLNLPL